MILRDSTRHIHAQPPAQRLRPALKHRLYVVLLREQVFTALVKRPTVLRELHFPCRPVQQAGAYLILQLANRHGGARFLQAHRFRGTRKACELGYAHEAAQGLESTQKTPDRLFSRIEHYGAMALVFPKPTQHKTKHTQTKKTQPRTTNNESQ